MRTRDLKSAARRMGRDAGISAASWVEIDETNAATILMGFEDGDPVVYDAFRFPNLSGEYADDPTPQSLAEDLDLAEDDPRADWLIDEVCTAWETAASEAFEREICKRCRVYV